MDIKWLLNLPAPIKGAAPSSTSSLTLKAGDLLTAAVLEVNKGRDALLAFGQFRAYARLPLPVVTGQNIQIQIQQAENGLQMVMLANGEDQPASHVQGNANPRIFPPPPDTGAEVQTKNNGRPISSEPGTGRSPIKGQAIQGSMIPAKNDGSAPPPEIRSGDLRIHIFEPVSERPSLSAHAHLLRPGESLDGRVTGFTKNGLMLVDFGKFKSFTKIDVPVREGQVLPLTVEKTEQGILLSVRGTGSRAAANAPSPAASATAPELAGRTLERSPSAAPPPNQVSSPAGTTTNQPPPHQSAVPVSPPTAPEMARLGDQIQRLLGHFEQSESLPGKQLPQTTQAALAHLQQLLKPVPITGDPAKLMASIKNFVENSGLYFEKKIEAAIRSLQDGATSLTPRELAQHPSVHDLVVQDLKPNLLILKRFIDSQPVERQTADQHVLETMKSVIQRTLANIEQQQTGATEKPVDPDSFQAFSHLLLLADHGRDARLKVYYAKKGRRDGADKTPRVALLLEMDRMGTVRTDLWMIGRDLNITFFVETEEARAEINAWQADIKTALKERFNTVAVSAVVNSKKIEQFDEKDVGPVSRRLLDLSI